MRNPSRSPRPREDGAPSAIAAVALRRSSASGLSPDQPAGLPRTSQPPAFWSIASLLAIALTTMGASWSCGPLFVLSDGDRACEIVVLHEDGRLDLTCLDALPRACHSDDDCLAAERCQASAYETCLLTTAGTSSTVVPPASRVPGTTTSRSSRPALRPRLAAFSSHPRA